MNRHTDRTSPLQSDPSPISTTSKGLSRHRIGEVMRGITLGAVAFLLGSCPLLFGTVPLGIALLSASSAYTLYICGGLATAGFLSPGAMDGWGYMGICLFCLGVRLLVRLYVDPPTAEDGRSMRAGAYLKACMRSVIRRFDASDEPAGTAAEDYYTGKNTGFTGNGDRASTAQNRGSTVCDFAGQGGKSASLPPRLFGEHPFLRMMTAALTGFAAGLISWILGGFRVYDLLALLFLVPFAPLATAIFIASFGEAGLTLLFSPTPLAVIRRAAQAAENTAEAGETHRAATAALPRSTGVFSRLISLSERLEGALGDEGILSEPSAPSSSPLRGMSRLTACYPLLPLISVGVLLISVVYAARPFSVAPFGAYLRLSLAPLLALLLTLSAADRLGVLPGLGSAVLYGVAADAKLIPTLMITAGVYALLRGLSHRAGVIGGCTAGAVYTAMAEDIVHLGSRLPAMVLAIPLYLLLERLWTGFPIEGAAGTHTDPAAEELSERISAAMTAEARAKAQRARIEALSDALGLLSNRFYKLSGRLRQPRLSELRRLTAEALTDRCTHCRSSGSCRAQRELLTTRLSEQLAVLLHRHGRVDAADLPDELYDLCPYLEELCTDIGLRYARLAESLSHSEKTDVFASDYAAMAAILSDVLEEDAPDVATAEANRATADRIFNYLTAEGVAVQGVAVTGVRAGHRRVIVQGRGLERLQAAAPTIRDHLEELCDARLALPAFEHSPEDDVSVMTLSPEASLDVRYSGSTVPAGTRPDEVLPEPLCDDTPRGDYTPPAVCGDHIALFSTEGACFYALISDGMGSGEDASLTSDICAMFLERMLSAGGRVEVSLRMLDSYICAKNTGTRDECSATVDLMELDLLDGQAVFAKSGASPTYVVRDGTVYKLRSRTMPLGILKGMDPRLLRFRMHPGDVVVMVSDGVTLGNDDCPWLIDLLSSPLPSSMDTLRADIIRRALSAGSEDDLSAIAIRVEEMPQA